jgi:hypothetical protein
MNWLKSLLIFSALAPLLSCGVKGDPLPPERPAELGRGRPTYKRATESLNIENAHSSDSKRTPVRDNDEDEDEE